MIPKQRWFRSACLLALTSALIPLLLGDFARGSSPNRPDQQFEIYLPVVERGPHRLQGDVYESLVAVDGDFAYAISRPGSGRETELSVIDVSDPTDPRLVGNTAWPDQGGIVTDMAISGSRLFVLIYQYEHSTLHIIDVEQPFYPRRASIMRLDWSSLTLMAVGSRVYVGGGYRECQEDQPTCDFVGPGLLVVDASEPSEPRVVDMLPTAVFVFDIALEGQRAVLAGRLHEPGEVGRNALELLDLSDPDSPRVTGLLSDPDPDSASDDGSDTFMATILDDKAYLTDHHRLFVADISDLDTPAWAGRISLDAFEWPCIGELLGAEQQLVARMPEDCGTLALYAFEPPSMQGDQVPIDIPRVGRLPLGYGGYDKYTYSMATQGDRVFLLEVLDAVGLVLTIVDVSHPVEPRILGRLD